MKILGVLPLAGSGIRLGATFHKALMPIPHEGSIKPIVEFSIDRLRHICKEIIAVTSPESKYPFPIEQFDLTNVVKEKQGEFASSFSIAAAYARENGFTHIATSLPDTLWFPESAFLSLLRTLEDASNVDGVLGLFWGDMRMLDAVDYDSVTGLVTGVTLHLSQTEEYSEGWGWGIFILSVERAFELSDDKSVAEQFNSFKLVSHRLDGDYLDIGTPDRYVAALKRTT